MQSRNYFLYARKSSESEDRQVESIKDQIRECTRLAEQNGLTIIDTITEAKSAKEPGRKEFNQMLKRIHKGEAQGIIAWKLNRLARNPIDGGQISWMLQQNIIQHIQTNGNDYKPTDNVLMMQVEFGMANQYVKDLSADVKRGTGQKAERGWFPASVLPLGYKHHKLQVRKVHPQEIVPDPNLFPTIKKLWQLLLSGEYSMADLKRKGDQMGLVNPRTKRPLAKGSYHRMFTNEFYCGVFYWKDTEGRLKRYKGKHRKMISPLDFEKAQQILGLRGKPTKVNKQQFTYSGLWQCGECKASVTAERKHFVRCSKCLYRFSALTRSSCPKCKTAIEQMDQPLQYRFSYYRCTKKTGPCSQKYLSEVKLEKKLNQLFRDIQVPEDFYQWGVQVLQEKQALNQTKDQKETSILKKQKTELKNRLHSLLLMRADQEIDRDQYDQLKQETEDQLNRLRDQPEFEKQQKTDFQKALKDSLNLCHNAFEVFQNASPEDKKRMICSVGSNRVIMAQKPYISKRNSLMNVQNAYRLYMAEKRRLEQQNPFITYSEIMRLLLANERLRTELIKVRNFFLRFGSITD